MQELPMDVRWYAGYKEREKPYSFIIGGKEVNIKRIIHEELVEDLTTGNRKRVFMVETADGIYKLVYTKNDWTVISLRL